MKRAKAWKGLLRLICLIVLLTVANLSIEIGMNGMWLWGIPKPEDVASVSIRYPSLTEEAKEITDREEIELCVDMTGFLKYRPFAPAEGNDGPLITFTYRLSDGEQVEVSANATAVFYHGKKHLLKHDDIFLNAAEGIFFVEEASDR